LGKFYQGVRQDLVLYARQLGWFHSIPQSRDKSAESQRLTRMDKIIENGGTPLLPPVGDAEYLLEYWRAVGMAISNGMGTAPITATELTHWANAQGLELAPWEFAALLEMSRTYLGAMQQGENPNSLPPYGDPVNQFDRQKVANKVSNAFKAFIGASKRK